ncbi:hypothetical protein MHLP_02985 [Candidatus Mycoplasma haematolamae str. Purdue]|uniref:Uncharacterized protein n=1 Tax=Mycoplasma haematolamae (strain Purdue) TaxID=1212765 RepID=I7C6M4_MYCHA|nr:hypothetical protein [Candidatus Mycoplasma haematolamae]AFO52177.1 hypothetical protein MHLP_02985 [Candidatus Mycoplasma haematolamae str. Purdue]
MHPFLKIFVPIASLGSGVSAVTVTSLSTKDNSKTFTFTVGSESHYLYCPAQSDKFPLPNISSDKQKIVCEYDSSKTTSSNLYRFEQKGAGQQEGDKEFECTYKGNDKYDCKGENNKTLKFELLKESEPQSSLKIIVT